MTSTTKHINRLSNISFYADIARESYAEASELISIIKSFDDQLKVEKDEVERTRLHFESMPHEQKLAKLSINVVVYASMALEAYIYDYASRELGKRFVENHIDRLNIQSKYIVATQLITQSKFPKEQEVYRRLDQMVKFRNKLVHSKSIQFDPTNQELLEKQYNVHFKQFEEARNAIKAMDLIAEYIKSIDAREPIDMFLSC
jgi:hypothetical protein